MDTGTHLPVSSLPLCGKSSIKAALSGSASMPDRSEYWDRANGL